MKKKTQKSKEQKTYTMEHLKIMFWNTINVKYPLVNVCGFVYSAAEVLQKIDPKFFNEVFKMWIDFNFKKQGVKWAPKKSDCFFIPGLAKRPK